MNTTTTPFILAAIVAVPGTAGDRSTMSPAELIVGEWKNATKTFAPDPEYPNSREYFSPVDTTKKTGTRWLKHEDGKKESSPYSVVREDKSDRVLEIYIHLADNRKRKALFKFDDTGTKIVQHLYVTDKFHIETHHLYVGAGVPAWAKTKEQRKGSGQPYMVRVAVNDDTERNPVHPKAEIWFRGHGTWWLKPELEYGGTVKNLGTRPSGTEQTLIIYPESRDGKEIKVPYMMTDEMNPNGSPRDMISVDISDTVITVHGLPIKAATGVFELKYER